jgi:hypothetical protein
MRSTSLLRLSSARTEKLPRVGKLIASPQKIADDGGLYLFVTPNGTKAWRLAYRYDGKQKSLGLGRYPLVTLGEARQQCRNYPASRIFRNFCTGLPRPATMACDNVQIIALASVP